MINIGARVGDFVIEKQIGKGGMGEVFLARDTRLDVLRAVKVVCPKESSSSEKSDR